jgi:anti-sigma B factor antagonist
MKIEEIDFFTLVRLDTNSLDLGNVSRLASILDDICAGKCKHHRDIVLDLGAINRLDSSGIGLLIHFNRVVVKYGCNMYFINTSEPIERILDITKLDGYFKVYKDYEELMLNYNKEEDNE